MLTDLQDTDTSDSYSYGVSIGGFSGTHPELPNGGTTTLSGYGHIMKGTTTATFDETTAGSTDLNPHPSGPRVSSRGDLNNTQTGFS